MLSLYLTLCLSATSCHVLEVDSGLTVEDCDDAIHAPPAEVAAIDLSKFDVAWLSCSKD